MSTRSYVYVAAVALAAVFLVLSFSWTGLAAFTIEQWLGLGAFVGLCLLSEAMAVDYTVGSNRTAKSSMAYLPLLTCAVVFPPQAAILVAATFEALTEVIFRGPKIWKFSFNVSLAVLAVGFGAILYGLLGGYSPGVFRVPLLPFFAMALTFSIVNMLIVSVFYAIRNQTTFLLVFRQVVGPGAVNVLYSLLGSPIAVFAAYLYDSLYIGGLLLIILPLMLVRYSYLSKIQLQQANRDLLKVLIKTIETRDPYTSGHSLRVSRLARAIAEDMGLPLRRIDTVETAALLHDVGKIDSVYAEIIRKPTALTDDEHRVIKTHSVKGAELLQSLTSFPDEVVQSVRHHHERYDGRGYPDGISGTSIPLASRIIMLCDAIDAMLSDRPYRSALSIDEVEQEILRCSGSQFDPEIVDAVLRKNTLHRAAALIRGTTASTHDLAGV